MRKFFDGGVTNRCHTPCLHCGITSNKPDITMTNAAKKLNKARQQEPILLSIFQKVEKEYKELEEMFQLIGWGDLPEELKFAIESDVRGYIDELNGRYSTTCAGVQRRRESVDFWVNSYLDGICSLETALDALRVTKL